VNVLNRGKERIESILKRGGISASGIISGFATLNTITTSAREAVGGAKLILVVTPANAHADIAAMLAPYLENGQIIVLTPGRTGGALEFSAALKKHHTKADVIIGETQTILYTCRSSETADVNIVAFKRKVYFSAFPAVRTSEVASYLIGISKSYAAAADVLETSLNNVGCILHPTPTLLNMGGIENPGFRFKYYYEGITPTIARLLESLDAERLSLAKHLGVHGVSTRDWLHETYASTGVNLYEAIQNTKAYETIEAPNTIQHRYLLEDVPTGLVPISSLAHKFGIDVPITDRVIDLTSLACDIDFRRTGRTVSSLQIEHLNVQQLREYVKNGHV
jgi:opine dehydrogenase